MYKTTINGLKVYYNKSNETISIENDVYSQEVRTYNLDSLCECISNIKASKDFFGSETFYMKELGIHIKLRDLLKAYNKGY